MCLGGHLAFRCAFDKRVSAAVCYFATDIHSETLGKGKQSDSLKRCKEIEGEIFMIWGIVWLVLKKFLLSSILTRIQ